MRAGAVLQAIREVVNVGAYLPVAEALTLHGIYRESVLILTKSSVLNAVVANRGLLRGPERCRRLCGRVRYRLLCGLDCSSSAVGLSASQGASRLVLHLKGGQRVAT